MEQLLAPANLASALPTFITMFNMWMLGNKNILGWYLGLLNQVFWIYASLVAGTYFFILLSVFLTGIYIRNIMLWRAEARRADGRSADPRGA